MTKNKLDKSIIFSSFVCAAATFVCGFVFCLALLSNGASCYLRIQNFLQSTRGYQWFKELRGFGEDDWLRIIVVCGAVVFASAVLSMLFGYGKERKTWLALRGENNRRTEKEAEFVDYPTIQKKPEPVFYADEDEVAAVLKSCRRNPEEASWKKLNSMRADVLADYLKNEYPQVVAVVLSRLDAQKSAAVLDSFSGGFAAEVIEKMLNSLPIDGELAGTLGKTIADNIENYRENRAEDKVAAIWRYLDGKSETKILAALDSYAPDTAEILRNRAICFEDLLGLSPQQISQAAAIIGEPKLVIALRGASDELRNHFYSAMPDRQSKIISEALSRLGPIKLRDIEKAQQEIVGACKKMFAETLRGRKND